MFLIIALMLSISSVPAVAVVGGPGGKPVAGTICVGPARLSTRDPRGQAREAMRALVAGVQRIERIRAKTPADAGDRNCVEQKLAEARVGLQIAAGEMERLDADRACPNAGEDAYALHRLQLLIERTGELTSAARVCAMEDLSSIDTTTVEVQVSPAVPARASTEPPMPGQGPALRSPF